MTYLSLADAVARGSGTERAFLCPVHDDSRPSASLNMIKKVWYCYTCGARGNLEGEAALAEPNYEAMRAWYEEQLEEERVYPEAWLACFTAGPVHEYWCQRVGARAVDHFKLGFDPVRQAVTYPLRRTDGALLGVVRRHVDPDAATKYLYPRGTDIGQLLFNYDPGLAGDVVLVEGALDAIALWNAGIEAFAIYGARLSQTQINLIDKLDPARIFTCFDHDDAGWEAHKQVERAFRHRLVSRVTWPRSWGKDIDEIGLDRRREIMPDELVKQRVGV